MSIVIITLGAISYLMLISVALAILDRLAEAGIVDNGDDFWTILCLVWPVGLLVLSVWSLGVGLRILGRAAEPKFLGVGKFIVSSLVDGIDALKLRRGVKLPKATARDRSEGP